MHENSDTKKSKLLFEIAVLLALMISIGIYGNRASLGWIFTSKSTFQQTVGQILSSEVEAQGVHGRWRFHIVYGYQVGDHEFISDRVHFGYQAMDDPSYAEDYVEKYPVGKQVVVFYEENNPENAVLEPEVKWTGLLNLYIVLLLLPISVLAIATFFFIRSRKLSTPILTSPKN